MRTHTMTVRTPRRRLAVLAGLAFALAGPALAADAPKGGHTLSLGGGASAPAGPLLTRDQLRQCLSQQTALRSQGNEATRAQTELEASRKEISRLEAELQSERGAVDAGDDGAVAAFNAKLEHWRGLAEAYNAKLPAVNGRIDEYNAAQARWQGECGNRRYDEADYFAIQRGK
jgi:hypothetical protein